jgi:hypothetical protein
MFCHLRLFNPPTIFHVGRRIHRGVVTMKDRDAQEEMEKLKEKIEDLNESNED